MSRQTAKQTDRSFKDAAYSQLQRIGKAVGNRRRLELLELLSQGSRTVEELADELGVSAAVASQHLQKLKAAHLIASHREGTYVHYAIAGDDVADFYAALRNLAQARLPSLRAVTSERFDEANSAESVDLLLELVRRDDAILVDTRPAQEYEAGHVTDAVSMPIDELEERLDELPRDRKLVVHCRGPFCTFAERAVARLREAGFDAIRVELGIADFRARDLAITSESA